MTNLLRLVGKRTRAQSIQDYFFITLGIALYAIGYTAFVLPEQLVSGGVTGISSLLYYAFQWNPAVMIWGLNGILLLISFKGLNRQFTIRTIVGVTILSLMVALMKVVFEKFPLITPGEDRFMHIVIGALLGGSGLGLVNRYSRLSLGRVMQFVDISIICSSYILFHSAELIVYGVVFIVISSIMVDYVVNGTRQTVQFMIISKRYKTMADSINQNMGRGVTILHGQGWYSKSDVEVVMVLCRKYESQYLFNLIKAIDPDAMVSQSFCHGVFGEGFDKIK